MNAAIRRAAALALSTAAAQAAAVDVTPSGDAVPENLLRIELRLARPLAHPLDMDQVHLLDARGDTIDGAFLDLPLPGDDGRTITLLLHPGRVKSGVGANLALGRALHAGEAVTLVVDDPQLGTPLRKRWQVDAPARHALLAPDTRLDAPRPGTHDALQVHFDTPLTASAVRLLAVRGAQGDRVAGAAALRDGETTWRFVPAHAWVDGEYALMLHPRLEDVAGNRPCAPFEATRLAAVECATTALAFRVSRQGGS